MIGGAEIYAAALPLADGLVLTEIDRTTRATRASREWDREAWRVSQKETHTSADGLRFDFVLYERT